jgi:hypothetical protein
MPSILPVNIGERSVAARMIALAAEITEHRMRLVRVLHGELRIVDRAPVDARRRAGLEPRGAERQCAQALGELVRRRVPGATTGVVVETHVDAPREEGAHGQHHGGRAEFDAGDRDHAADAVVFDDQIAAFLLEQREVRLVLERAAHERLVELAVRLHASRAHRGTLAGVQGARLDCGGIGRARHHAPERIDLLDQVTLADATDGRVAAHLPQRLDGLREQQRARSHAGSRQRGFGAGMPATHHDYVKIARRCHLNHAGSKS